MKYTIAGLDEVGRGALFGPVFAGAVMLDKQSESFKNEILSSFFSLYDCIRPIW